MSVFTEVAVSMRKYLGLCKTPKIKIVKFVYIFDLGRNKQSINNKGFLVIYTEIYGS
jgi:hypothetical protein